MRWGDEFPGQSPLFVRMLIALVERMVCVTVGHDMLGPRCMRCGKFHKST